MAAMMMRTVPVSLFLLIMPYPNQPYPADLMRRDQQQPYLVLRQNGVGSG
jgi:hypothetical protein